MLSNKWTFSLTSFVVLIAFGLVCFVPSVMADGDAKKTHFDIDVKISAAESMIDVSHRGGDNDIQIATGRDRVSRDFAQADALTITLLVEFSQKVELMGPELVATDIAATPVVSLKSGPAFGPDDIFIRAFDKDGRALGTITLDKVATVADSIFAFRDSAKPGQQFLVRIDESKLEEAYKTALRAPTDAGLEIYSVVFYIRKGAGADPGDTADAAASAGVRKADLAHVISHIGPDAHQHLNKASNLFQVDLVDDDQGDPMYHVGVSATEIAADGAPGTSGSGTPGVVAVQSFRERAGLIETGAFDVRIILTEEPKGIADIIKDPSILIDVVNGSVTTLTAGATLKGASTLPVQANELMAAMAGYTTMVGGEAVEADLPQATGRDNKYHQYFATITPNPGVNGDVIVSVKQFADNVKPLSKEYVPLTAEQRIAVTLSASEETVRDARVANETLTVTVNAAADTLVAAATAAYKTRQEDVLDKVANEIQLANKAVIPAGGYLVLAADLTKAGIAASPAKLAEKEKGAAATEDYNTMGLGLKFPADDLDNFFRNGGTLNLGYADIPAATGSGHDDAKAVAEAGHADDTGYAGATTNAYAAGTLIINEIMWGLNGGADPITGSQYIELHNPGTADVTIDSKEWVITAGSLPPGYAAIDTVSNNPATGYWAVPGSGGVTAVSVEYPTVVDLVSMSRVTGATDGTAAASWAASIRPSANLGGRRIGTPGATNSYAMPAAVPDVTVEPVIPAAPAAKSGDLMITEIMVASNDGRLPQWIELANVSAAAVSVSGWSLEVDNDSADADVVGAGDTIVIDLGDVEIGADQVALVVTKEGRDTSGIGDGEGDLRADRIIDVQSDVSPDNARYSLISEMGFMISLIPPQTGAVRKPGDVVGNLDGGWELPASEGDRSSLIRREMGDAGEIMGTDAASWVLASDTLLGGAYLTTYYGSADDIGTPGYNAGGNLPVELSGFGAKRDPLTGAVVITWSTQSELNNAGFFIKRSQQTNGKFVVVNPTMIAGAGTTAEKQSYTYTDATADPNIVYFYQIEDVSLDGNRQTLTRAHRLKGHIGAAGKATTTWGELKSSRD